MHKTRARVTHQVHKAQERERIRIRKKSVTFEPHPLKPSSQPVVLTIVKLPAFLLAAAVPVSREGESTNASRRESSESQYDA